MNSKPDVVRIGPDTHVTLAFVLFDQDGNVFEQATREEPLTYVHGYAQIVPGLERGVAGLARGEKRELVVDPEEAFGDPDEKAVVEIDKADLPDVGRPLQVGDELIAEDDEDDQILMRVVEVRAGSVLVDTNHPLAGQTVRFEVEVCDVRTATEDEIADAEAELEERANGLSCCDGEHDHDHDHAHDHAHPHDHDHDHGHDHGGDGSPIVQLRRKLSN
ncbi:MAG: peptidylprolyl isomerase [Polyangiaceae bacterium]